MKKNRRENTIKTTYLVNFECALACVCQSTVTRMRIIRKGSPIKFISASQCFSNTLYLKSAMLDN